MKKLLLASIIMIGFGTVASAQSSEAMQAKKAAAKKEANQPVISNADGEVAKVKATETPKTDAELSAKEPEVKKVAAPQKAAKPAAKKTKQN
ncbi:MAG: hypothetical protein IPJ02_06320 [Chitinophagaceae bacterium]|nr:hypothetical protein [Chitinophagaceae bacterium]